MCMVLLYMCIPTYIENICETNSSNKLRAFETAKTNKHIIILSRSAIRPGKSRQEIVTMFSQRRLQSNSELVKI